MKILNHLKMKAQPKRTQRRFNNAKVQTMYMFLSIDNHVFTLSIIYFYNCTVFTFLPVGKALLTYLIFCNVFFYIKKVST